MPEHDDDLTLPGQPPRRTVLRGALVLGAAGVLAGCGGSSSDNSAASQAPAAPAPETTPSPTATAKAKKKKASAKPTATATSEAKPKATTAAKPKGTELGPTSEVPVGGGKIYDDKKIVVTQPKKGEFLAFSAVCTHQDCIVADCDGGTINCGCHESSFSITDGHPLSGPATQTGPLPKKKVQVAGGKVYEV